MVFARKSRQQLVTTDKAIPHYRYWQAIYLAFFSRQLYVDVVKRWHGFAVGFLLLLIAIAVLPLSARVIYDFNSDYNKKIIAPFNLLPPIYLQQGQVTIDKPMPYMIKDKQNNIVAIIDTTGKITDFDRNYPKLSILILRDKLRYRPQMPELFFTHSQSASSALSVTTYTFSTDMNEVFDGSKWVQTSGIKNIKFLADVIIYPTIVLLFFIIYFIFILAFALMAQLMTSLMSNVVITYKQGFRLLIVSAVPHLVIMLGLFALNLLVTGVSLLLVGLFAVYFIFAVLALKSEHRQMINRQS